MVSVAMRFRIAFMVGTSQLEWWASRVIESVAFSSKTSPNNAVPNSRRVGSVHGGVAFHLH
jgi:hypothetical protein